MSSKRILHVITGLNDGGVEAVLASFCTHDKSNLHHVLSLSGPGKYGSLISSYASVSCLRLGVLTISVIPNIFTALLNIIKFDPHVIQGWMYHGCFMSSILSIFLPRAKIFWSIHNTVLEKGSSKTTTILISNILAVISRFSPSQIIYCAESALMHHLKIGYCSSRSCVINNGYDFARFSPTKYNSPLGSDSDASSIVNLSMIARYDPYKDHPTLLKSLALLADQGVNFHCYLVGSGVDKNNITLVSLVRDLNLEGRVSLKGQISDIPQFLSKIDVNLLSSSAEAFPNVLVESMACGVPCVSTDVGDARIILDGYGEIVPVRDPRSFAFQTAALISKLKVPKLRAKIQADCVNSVKARFSIETMVVLYNSIWST